MLPPSLHVHETAPAASAVFAFRPAARLTPLGYVTAISHRRPGEVRAATTALRPRSTDPGGVTICTEAAGATVAVGPGAAVVVAVGRVGVGVRVAGGGAGVRVGVASTAVQPAVGAVLDVAGGSAGVNLARAARRVVGLASIVGATRTGSTASSSRPESLVAVAGIVASAVGAAAVIADVCATVAVGTNGDAVTNAITGARAGVPVGPLAASRAPVLPPALGWLELVHGVGVGGVRPPHAISADVSSGSQRRIDGAA